jgi:Zn ribbon nucleic-acid-binding protein
MATGGRDGSDVRCPRCGSMSLPVAGDPVRRCSSCNKPLGPDDSYDQIDISNMPACTCGAVGADDFAFRSVDGVLSLVCVHCGKTLETNETSDSDDVDGGPTRRRGDSPTFDAGSFECPKCTNNDDRRFKAEYNLKTGRLYKIKCLVCGHGNTNRENAPVKGK